MRVIQYLSTEDEKPTDSAVKVEGTADKWILLDGSEKDKLPPGATLLDTVDGKAAIKRKTPLPKSHALYKWGDSIPEGPFPAGSLPGDLRYNDDGSTDYYDKSGNWYKYSENDGVPTDPDITPEPRILIAPVVVPR